MVSSGPLPHEDATAPASPPLRRDGRVWLGGILILAAALRLYDLGGAPPGLYTDEVSVAYNAYCLRKTGMDWTGRPWPLLRFRAYREQPTCLYLYLSIPFQAAGGMNGTTHRLPSALGSIAAVLLMYVVAGRMFGRAVGLVAAAMLAISPWHILMSRLAMSSGVSLDPLGVLGALAVVLWAHLPLDDQPPVPRPRRAAVAGLAVPVAMYGYWAGKVFLPALLAVSVLLGWRRWRDLLRARGGPLMVALLAICGLVAVSPVAYDLAANWTLVSGRADVVWQGSSGLWPVVRGMAARYWPHYAPGFLFLEGDSSWGHAMTGGGVLYWFMLPLILIGLAVAAWQARRSLAARVVLAWFVLYPIADLVAVHPTCHLLRSWPGMAVFSILAALGAVRAVQWVRVRARALAVAAVGLIVAASAVATARQAYLFFVDYPSRPTLRQKLYADFLEAMEWLRPRFDEFDQVYLTFPNAFDQPFAYALVGLQYDPRRWLSDKLEVADNPMGPTIVTFGKVRFLAGQTGEPLDELQNNDTLDRVLFVVRPGQIGTAIPPVHLIHLPDGTVSLEVYVLEF